MPRHDFRLRQRLRRDKMARQAGCKAQGKTESFCQLSVVRSEKRIKQRAQSEGLCIYPMLHAPCSVLLSPCPEPVEGLTPEFFYFAVNLFPSVFPSVRLHLTRYTTHYFRLIRLTKRLLVKNPDPKDPALDCPLRGFPYSFPLAAVGWSDGALKNIKF